MLWEECSIGRIGATAGADLGFEPGFFSLATLDSPYGVGHSVVNKLLTKCSQDVGFLVFKCGLHRGGSGSPVLPRIFAKESAIHGRFPLLANYSTHAEIANQKPIQVGIC